MRRARGSVYRRADSPFWWIGYSVNGTKFRENTHTTKERAARKILDKRLGEVSTGVFVGPDVNRITLDELAEDFLREYRTNARKSLSHAERRWRLHLRPFFMVYKAAQVTSTLLARYVEARLQAGAENSTVNRELSCLRRMYSLGMSATPAKVLHAPKIPHLAERNVRLGFLEPAERDRLAVECAKIGLWLRCMFQLGCDFGWRKSELLNLRVSQVDLAERAVRLDVGSTKNGAGRLAILTDACYVLIRECIRGKKPEEYVFTRNGRRVRDFRGAWRKACCAAGVGRMVCADCPGAVTVDSANRCPQCSRVWTAKELHYAGLIFHDLRRSAVRSMVRSGISERVAMTVTGHKTRSVFDRYNIVSETDLREAARKMQAEAEKKPFVTQLGHDSVTVALPAQVHAVN
jgi:integrase